MALEIIKDIKEMKEYARGLRAGGETIAFVPTMGALHDGHRKLLKMGRALGTKLVLSIFVNPAQFCVGEDFGEYPRTLPHDLDVAREEGVDCVFTPDVGEIYPEGYRTYVNVEGFGEVLCGASRPGHFRGVATIVLKLFDIVAPDKAVFGKKDFQQLVVIRKMVEDLSLDVEIIEAETVREDDGLAMSSRNSYLSEEERRAASAVPRALNAARGLFAEGARDSGELVKVARKVLKSEKLVEVEYVAIVDPATLRDVERIRGRSVLAVAVRVGPARLIDNMELKP